MKRYRVTFRKAAKTDLQAIFSFILEVSRSRRTAVGYIRRVRDRCARIGDAPFSGVARPDLDAGLRMAVFERRIVILYLVENDRVRITNIFFGAQDYEALLRGNE